MVHCLSLRWFRVSYRHGSPARESRMSLCVQAAANSASITGNSSPEVMMIMDFAANDFGWAALLASSAESTAIFMNKKYGGRDFFWSLSLLVGLDMNHLLDLMWVENGLGWSWWQTALMFLSLTCSPNNIHYCFYIKSVFPQRKQLIQLLWSLFLFISVFCSLFLQKWQKHIFIVILMSHGKSSKSMLSQEKSR